MFAVHLVQASDLLAGQMGKHQSCHAGATDLVSVPLTVVSNKPVKGNYTKSVLSAYRINFLP